jgi:putative flippase GtrA
MKNSVVPNDVDEFSSVLLGLGEPSSFLSTSQDSAAHLFDNAFAPAKVARSYQPYTWNLLNSILDLVDAKTNGRAGWLQRFVSYLFFGGVAALVNLSVFYIMFYHVLAPLNPTLLRNILSYVVAAEISILANFIPNDRFTFSSLPGAKRPWMQRCTRFHMTTIVGSLLTFLIELGLSTFTHTQPIIAEAIATLLVLIYNFSFHHLFTYRHVKEA